MHNLEKMQRNLPALQPSKLNPKLYGLSNCSVFQLQTMVYYRDGGAQHTSGSTPRNLNPTPQKNCLFLGMVRMARNIMEQKTGFWQSADSHREPVKDVPKTRFRPEKHPEVPFGRSVDGFRWEGGKSMVFQQPLPK